MAEPTTPCSLAPEVILKPSIVREREARVIDLQKIGNEFTFSDNQWRNLLENITEGLESNECKYVELVV